MREIIFVALLYLACGRLSLLLAIPPGYASTIFPSSGIALAAILLRGYRVWPGIWLGSFAMNFWVSLGSHTHAALPLFLLVSSGIGIGATLQAAAGGTLIRKIVGFPNPLVDPTDVTKFLVLGALSCLVNATLGVTTLWLGGLLNNGGWYLFSIWTWWVGDALGVIVFTPLAIMWFGEPKEIWAKRRPTVTSTLVIAFLMTTVFYTYATHNDKQAMQHFFQFFMAGGLLLTGLLGAFLLIVTGRHILIQKKVDEQTEALRKAQVNLEQEVWDRTAELRIANQELADSNADLLHFAFVASHDLQEPLRMVATHLQYLQKHAEGKLDTEELQAIAFAVKGATRMQSLIKDLLAFAKVGRGERRLEMHDIGRIVEQATWDLTKTIEESGAKIDIGPLPTLRIDASQLVQVFQNLLSNGIKYSGESIPELSIHAKESEGDWIFSVKDNGIGIDSRYSEKVFGPFQRLNSDRERYPGTGIGLSICKRVIERHQGKIWVESELGRGATFYFTLPKDIRTQPEPRLNKKTVSFSETRLPQS